MRWRGKLISLAVVGMAVVSVLLAWGMREPRYGGQTLTSWLEEYSNNSLSRTPQVGEAQSAVRAIGAEKALPYLMRMVRAKDEPIRLWIMEQNKKWELPGFELKKDADLQRLGMAGFEVLETNAAPAVPELIRLLSDTNHALTAVKCLGFIGKPAQEPFCQALTNSDLGVRQFSAKRLASVMDSTEAYLVQIKGCLNDADNEVRLIAVDGIGAKTDKPDLAIPLLVTALNDVNEQVASRAARLLSDFGTNALQAFGALTNVVENGTQKTAGTALRTLIAVAPKETLPVVLELLHSDDVGRRRVSMLMLNNYPVKAPGIQAAVERAVGDPDKAVSNLAKDFVDQQQLELGEPVYGGKGLGEWLKESVLLEPPRHSEKNPLERLKGRVARLELGEDTAFTREAEEAIRQMGTNAIPALLKRLMFESPINHRASLVVNTEAVRAFTTLGGEAKPALPQLMSLMDNQDRNVAMNAMRASFGMGVEALPCVFKGLTNLHSAVRIEALGYLMRNENADFKAQRKQAVPLVVKLLQDKYVGEVARSALKEIDPEAGIVAEGKERK